MAFHDVSHLGKYGLGACQEHGTSTYESPSNLESRSGVHHAVLGATALGVVFVLWGYLFFMGASVNFRPC